MGQELADDVIIFGNSCSTCNNLLWAAGETPKYVYAHFSQMQRCPGVPWGIYPLPPNNRVFRLEQVIGHPCWWRYREPLGWEVNWQAVTGIPSYSRVSLGHATGGTYFQGLSTYPDYCVSTFANRNVCGGVFLAYGGFCWIEWKEIAIAAAEKAGIPLTPTLFYEVFQIDLVTLVYKFTDVKHSTNVKMKLIPPWCL